MSATKIEFDPAAEKIVLDPKVVRRTATFSGIAMLGPRRVTLRKPAEVPHG